MKKNLILLLLMFLSGMIFSQETLDSDISIYRDITQSFENQYYPGTIEKVDYLQQVYPDSVFTQAALVYKANALVNLQCYEDAIVTLQKAISQMHTGKKGFTQCHFLLGKSYFYLENYEEALKSFYTSAKLAAIDGEEVYYNYSIFYGAECFYKLSEFEKSYPLYEYVIENGEQFYPEDYDKAVQNLMLSYNKLGLFENTIDLYNAFELSHFNIDIKNILSLYCAEAYENLELYSDSYNLYCNVIKNGNEKLAIIALKNAYNLSESKKINVNPGNIFAQTTENFENNPELVNEFWIRLGIDEYNKKNYKKAESYFANVNENYPIINIYKAKIILDTDFSKNGGKRAEEILLSIKKITDDKESEIENIEDSYYSLLLQCAVQQNRWDDVPEIFKKIKVPDDKARYINSAYYYKKADYIKVTSDGGVLYPSALCKLGKFEEAVEVFEDLYNKGKLEEKYLIEYSKALFAIENYDKAYEIAEKSSDSQAAYIKGICCINKGDFEKAKEHFISYIKAMSNDDDFINLSLYYKGYAEYCLGEYKNSYGTFVRFGTEASENQKAYKRKAHYYGAISALQNNDFRNAAVQANNVIKTSSSEEEKIKATIFATEILRDSGEYDKAIELLKPYVNEKSDFTIEAMFRIAKIYEKQGKVNLADSIYKKISDDFPNTEYGEEALYRAGEVFYFVEDYPTAYKRFNDYVYKYVAGKFLDGALYFSGDCALKVGEINKSIMINKNMIAKFPESIYVYGAYKNLLDGYYFMEDYNSALEVAELIVNNYKEQAAADHIGTRLTELEKIVKGTDRRVVEKLSEYEKAGGYETKAGRKIGSEIVKLYAENSYTQKYAYEMAVEILKFQTESDEIENAAENAEFVGDYLRNNYENKKAAEYYLKAAQYYRTVDNSMKAAAVLYSAAEAFSADGLSGDARETAELLKKLYPNTKYAARVDKIVR